jgi:hypothetical protein
MTGCVLSDEGIEKIESKIGKSVDGMFDDIADLIATIRDHQEREQKLAKKVLESAELIHNLRETLNDIRNIRRYEVAKNPFQIGWNGALDGVLKRVDALAKVKGDE